MSNAPAVAAATYAPPPVESAGRAVLAPHPDLHSYYDGSRAKGAFLRSIFNETAVDYDRVERVLALGTGPWYRRQALRRAGLSRGMRVLDVAMGTGLVAREAMSIVGPGGRLVGVDPSAGMVREARAGLAGVSAVLGVGESLPVADAAFDFVSMGYALRHLPDLHAAFAEFHRVLRPGGRACVLEITRPAGALPRAALDGYFRVLLPIFARVIHTSPKTRDLWRYYWETIDRCVPPAAVMDALRAAGFAEVSRSISLGIFSEYVAVKRA